MSYVLAGIDEAGYGPVLGPLCVGLVVMKAPESDPPGVPDLWKLLKDGVSRNPGRAGKTDRRGRVVIGDSKRLKLSNAVQTVDPLINLERGVLALLRQIAALGDDFSDEALFARLAVEFGVQGWYRRPPTKLPASVTAGEIAIAGAVLERALANAGACVLEMRCHVTCESDFNRVLRETGNKADTTIAAVCEHLRRVWELYGDGSQGRLGVVCDRLGGRSDYTGVLTRAVPGAEIETVEVSPTRSRYVVTKKNRRAGVAFLVEGEDAHMPVAAASMTAKLVRELAMRRFNAHWCDVAKAAAIELRPTAGYSTDGRRWIREAESLIGDVQYEQLVRLA